jgi:hypothetical protein
MKLSTIRIVGYTQIALGLINLDYQRHKSSILAASISAVISGLIFIALTYLESIRNFITKRIGGIILGLIAAIIVAIQFKNFK